MDTWNYLFGFRGRINRTDFWSRFLMAFALFVAATMASYIPISVLKYLLVTALILAGFAAWLSATLERLHDRDKSAWYLLIFFGVPTIIANLVSPSPDGKTQFIFFFANISFLGLLSGALAVWMFSELGCLRGTEGPNRYGTDPLQPASDDTAPVEALEEPHQ
jgi:uncharacterized membrane protein YhaH (DUF805 family)